MFSYAGTPFPYLFGSYGLNCRSSLNDGFFGQIDMFLNGIDGQQLVATGIYRERINGIFRLLERKK